MITSTETAKSPMRCYNVMYKVDHNILFCANSAFHFVDGPEISIYSLIPVILDTVCTIYF